MQLPRDTTHIGVLHVLDRETRDCLRRLAAIRYYLPAPAGACPDSGVSPGVWVFSHVSGCEAASDPQPGAHVLRVIVTTATLCQ